MQICIDGTSAKLYDDCTEIESITFPGYSLPAVSLVGVLGEPFVLNETTFFSVS